MARGDARPVTEPASTRLVVERERTASSPRPHQRPAPQPRRRVLRRPEVPVEVPRGGPADRPAARAAATSIAGLTSSHVPLEREVQPAPIRARVEHPQPFQRRVRPLEVPVEDPGASELREPLPLVTESPKRPLDTPDADRQRPRPPAMTRPFGQAQASMPQPSAEALLAGGTPKLLCESGLTLVWPARLVRVDEVVILVAEDEVMVFDDSRGGILRRGTASARGDVEPAGCGRQARRRCLSTIPTPMKTKKNIVTCVRWRYAVPTFPCIRA